MGRAEHRGDDRDRAVSDGDVRRRAPDRGGGGVRGRRGDPQRRLQRQLRHRRLLRAARGRDRGRARSRVLAARSRRRLADDQAALRAPARARPQIADTAVAIPEVVDRVGALLVPAFADICVIDVLRGGRVERLGVVAHGPDAARIEERLRARGPWTVEAIRAGRPLLVEHVDEAHPARQRPRRGRLRVPALAAASARTSTSRCARAGATSARSRCWRSRVPTAPVDLQLAKLLAGRIGLALDNAGLFAELEALQRRLTTALDTLAEAVTIQDDRRQPGLRQRGRGGRARLRAPAELLATPPREIADAYDSFNEDGTPLRPRGAARRAGCSRARRRSRCWCASINRRTGEERWRMVKATPCRCARASRGWRST